MTPARLVPFLLVGAALCYERQRRRVRSARLGPALPAVGGRTAGIAASPRTLWYVTFRRLDDKRRRETFVVEARNADEAVREGRQLVATKEEPVLATSAVVRPASRG